jgi:hypothetical protein
VRAVRAVQQKGFWVCWHLRSAAAAAVCTDGMWLDMSEAANFCTGSVCEVPRDNKTAVWGE